MFFVGESSRVLNWPTELGFFSRESFWKDSNKIWFVFLILYHTEQLSCCLLYHNIAFYQLTSLNFKNILVRITFLSIFHKGIQNFQKIYRSQSTLNCRSRHLCLKLTHTQHKWCKKLGNNPDWWVVMTNYVCKGIQTSK